MSASTSQPSVTTDGARRARTELFGKGLGGERRVDAELGVAHAGIAHGRIAE